VCRSVASPSIKFCRQKQLPCQNCRAAAVAGLSGIYYINQLSRNRHACGCCFALSSAAACPPNVPAPPVYTRQTSTGSEYICNNVNYYYEDHLSGVWMPEPTRTKFAAPSWQRAKLSNQVMQIRSKLVVLRKQALQRHHRTPASFSAAVPDKCALCLCRR
jgi:hypothetical protein